MSNHNKSDTSPKNHLLAALPSDDYQRILAQSESTVLEFGKVVYTRGEKIRDVFFVNSGIVSLLSTVDQRSMLEIGIVGREGMVGLPIFLGAEKSDNQAIIQGKGTALKLAADVFLNECKIGALVSVLHRYTHMLMMQISQSAVCNRFHTVDARLARWLLMMQDRMEADEFGMTQNFLSNMLGVRREAVTLAALDLQQLELINYERGRIEITDRPGLEAASCNCYSVIKNA